MTFKSVLAVHRAKGCERAGKKKREREQFKSEWRETQLPTHKSHNSLLMHVIKYFMIAQKTTVKSVFVRLNPICSSIHTPHSPIMNNKCTKNMQFILFFRNTKCFAIDQCTSCEQMKRVDTQGSRNRTVFSISYTFISFHTFIPYVVRAVVCTHFRPILCAKEKHVDGSMPCYLKKIKITYDVYCYCLQSIFTSLCGFRARSRENCSHVCRWARSGSVISFAIWIMHNLHCSCISIAHNGTLIARMNCCNGKRCTSWN